MKWFNFSARKRETKRRYEREQAQRTQRARRTQREWGTESEQPCACRQGNLVSPSATRLLCVLCVLRVLCVPSDFRAFARFRAFAQRGRTATWTCLYAGGPVAALGQRGAARAEVTRPKTFPHRIWAACDFESHTRDYGWFGAPEKVNIPRYAGNQTALRAEAGPYQNFSAVMAGINPVPGPRMGKVNKLYLRYYMEGSTEATFQHFSLSTNDNNHIRVSGLTPGRWSEVTLDFTRAGRRNDGTPGVPFAEGERMDDFKLFAGKPEEAKRHRLLIDDVIFFAEDPDLPPEPEPFPNRVIYLAAFDTGPKEQYWPGEFEIVEKDLPPGSYWRVARAVPRQNAPGKWVRLQIEPTRPVGARTKLRLRYFLTGTSKMTAQIFDLTDQDNRHIHLSGLKQGSWQTLYLDFTRDAKRNDGSTTPFVAGHVVDDLFFFLEGDAGAEVNLLLDEVVLFDAGR